MYDKNDALIVNPSWNIYISCSKPDSTYILNSKDIIIEDNCITVPVTKQMTACAGTVACELVLTNEGKELYTNTFYLYITPNTQTGEQVESSNEYDSIGDAVRQVEELLSKIDYLHEEIMSTSEPSLTDGSYWLKMI